MSNTKLSGLLNTPIPTWEEAVVKYLHEGALNHE